jgi:predicted O-linked N-acetylglucosamine transferase (SPINDLY family)
MGYPGTTGLNAMDYYLADPFFLPADRFETQFTEKIVRLRANAPFLPYPDAPDINPLPALKNGYITFASFNQLHKYTTETTQRWAQLLIALPDSKLLVGGLASNVQADATAMFTPFGIEPSRLQFRQRGPIFDYLKLHHDVDLCLDTYPYNGGTTTMHALWMGVPTLSLEGPTPASRQGAIVLGHAGLDQFLVNDASDYVQRGINLTADLPALANIRSGLRTRFAKTAYGQPAAITASLENALRIMWQRWCAGLPAISFDA